MNNPLLKYKIGFSVLAVFTFGILVAVLVQAGAVKQDKATYKAAEKVAEKLNAYIDEEQKIPSNLDAAGISGANKNIKFDTLSDEKYKFCVTYQTNKNYAALGVESAVLGVLYGSNDYGSESSDEYESETLYLDEYHKKGKNCQIVKPYMYDTYDDEIYNQNDTSDSSSPAAEEGAALHAECSNQYHANVTSPTALDEYYACMAGS